MTIRVSGLFYASAMMVSAVAPAQSPSGIAAAVPEIGDTMLPGDAPAPGLPRMLQLPRPHPPEPLDATPGPSLPLALEAAQAVLETCRAQGLHVGTAVVDSAGNLRVGLVSEGASPGRIYTAVRKDLAAIAWGQPTSAVQKALRADPSSAAGRFKPGMIVVAGGVPLFAGGRIVGAIAASGATGDQDEACAQAGAARIGGRLR